MAQEQPPAKIYPVRIYPAKDMGPINRMLENANEESRLFVQSKKAAYLSVEMKWEAFDHAYHLLQDLNMDTSDANLYRARSALEGYHVRVSRAQHPDSNSDSDYDE
jgi:hypothetical protein